MRQGSPCSSTPTSTPTHIHTHLRVELQVQDHLLQRGHHVDVALREAAVGPARGGTRELRQLFFTRCCMGCLCVVRVCVREGSVLFVWVVWWGEECRLVSGPAWVYPLCPPYSPFVTTDLDEDAGALVEEGAGLPDVLGTVLKALVRGGGAIAYLGRSGWLCFDSTHAHRHIMHTHTEG